MDEFTRESIIEVANGANQNVGCISRTEFTRLTGVRMRRIFCRKSLCALVLLVVVAAAITGCGENREATVRRRASLTPEQRQAEDQSAVEAEAKKKKEDELERREAGAVTISQDYVRKFLKHPDDASFDSWDAPEVKWNPAGDTFFVSSKVKAKNDFGGELTYRWATILTLKANTWDLVSCVIDDKEVYTSDALLNELKSQRQSAGREEKEAAKRAEAEARKERQAAIEEAKWRTWTDASGKHKTEAKYSGTLNGEVMLLKRNGSKIQLPLDRLSDEDREWIANRSK